VLITKKGRKIIVQDLHSTNGVFVNGKRIKKPVSIKNKDEIVIGNTKLTLLRREAGGVKNPSYYNKTLSITALIGILASLLLSFQKSVFRRFLSMDL